MRLLLTHRRNLKRKFLDLENAIRHSLKSFGIKLGGTSRGKFDQAVRESAADDPLSCELMDAILSARAALWKEYWRLHDLVVKLVAQSELCRCVMARGRRPPRLQRSWGLGGGVSIGLLRPAKLCRARESLLAPASWHGVADGL